jgi:hypothetical protein
MVDEETPPAANSPAVDDDAAKAPTTKSMLIALGSIAVVMVIAIVLGQTLGKEEDEDSATSPEIPTTIDPEETTAPAPTDDTSGMYFNRIASFPVCLQLDEKCNVDTETVSEILYASEDGMMLVYTDAAMGALGFIDITDPANPLPAGTVDVGGEPTSTIVWGNYAVVGVNTSPDFVNPSGNLQIINMDSKQVIRTMDLGGQPDSLALSPDKTFIAVAIENERDEDLNDGLLPQLPAGFLVIVDSSSSDPMDWTSSNVDLTGLDGVLYDSDPEPEYVDINEDNLCVITMQENNALVLVDLSSGSIVKSFTAGTVDLDMIDIEDNGIVELTSSLTDVPREPDAVTWIGKDYFATADEGDLDGGGRGFTIYDTDGNVVYTSGTEMEYWTVRIGHYNEGRSDNKGNEPETVRYAEFGSMKLLFVNSERSSVVFVYEVTDVTAPVLRQILPAGIGPEGVFAIPSRNLLVVAAENDVREDKIRAHVSIYKLDDMAPTYPTLVSANREDGLPIPFSALSALSAKGNMLYSVDDSFYSKSRVFAIDTTKSPYMIVDDMRVLDSNDVLLGALDVNASAILLNEDKTVNLDQEGIEAIDGGFWIVSEGGGTVGDEAMPFETPNLLIRLDESAMIEEVVLLPENTTAIQVRFGFEGVAVDGDNVVVAFQRAWTGEDFPRLGVYNTIDETWKFAFYQLDLAESQYGGWVGLSDLTSLGAGSFLVLERDNQGGPDAAIKRLYEISLGDYSFEDGTVITEKVLIRDLMPDLMALGGLVPEKIEGLAITASGDVWINNDNDGVDDNSGEQQLINLGNII